MKVVILAGGYGTRFGALTDFLPKPMIPIGPRPILWHIMRIYAHYGHNDFIFCLGYKAELIKEYFLNFDAYDNDFTITCDGARTEQHIHRRHAQHFVPRVTLAYTGQDTMTGGRLKRIVPYLGDDEEFLLTYGDGVANVDINELIAFHRGHGKLATLTAVFPPPKFGDLRLVGDRITDFAEKKGGQGSHVNGGFYVFDRRVLDYLHDDRTCVLEKEPLERLASEGQLMAYRHDGFWQCMDTTRDMELLNRLWISGEAPWKVWQDDFLD